ncbi:MAG: transcription-repair coupling factor [Phycisphaerales bacterium]|nr:transcription-repair coupling factor [Phycisphaerales bacterium]
MDLIAHFGRDGRVKRAVDVARGGKRVLLRGSQGSSSSLIAGAMARLSQNTVLMVVGHLDEADETLDELLAAGMDAVRLPALEVLPGETGVSMELFLERLSVVRRLIGGGTPPEVLICPIQALMQPAPGAATLDALARTVKRGTRMDPGELVRWLENAGYERVDAIEEPGHFAMRGGIVDVYLPGNAGGAGGAGAALGASGAGVGVRLDFFGDEIDKITEIDLDTMGSDRVIESVELVCASLEKVMPATPAASKPGVARGGRASGGGARSAEVEPIAMAEIDATGGSASCSVLEYVPRSAMVVLNEPLEVTEQARGYFERLTDPRIYGPPAVLKVLQSRFTSFIEIAQFSGARAGGDVEHELPVRPLPEMPRDAGEGVRELARVALDDQAPTRISVFCENAGELSRFGELMDEHGAAAKSRVDASVAYVHRGFIWGDGEGSGGDLMILPYHELLHRFETRRRIGSTRRGRENSAEARLKTARAMDSFLDFGPGDYVVHRDHGIALFRGLVTQKPREVKRDGPVVLPGEKSAKKKARSRGEKDVDPDEGMEEYLTLEFAGSSKLYVPTSKIDHVQKYVGGFRGQPTLSALGGTRWKKQKQSVAESVKDLAGELLRIRAARESMPGVRYPADTTWQKEFEEEFPFPPTDDQVAAIGEIKKDMQSDRPMDRLLCGDVGYGKTEVAIRAAFKAMEFGKQVAVLVPTTVLAEQHERTFRSRLADYPFRVESVSRFKATKEINDTLAAVRKGQVDVIIGTHRLLSKDVHFADLGLVIIDEEQRFGVEHKERLLSLRLTVDVLTLSATPIPRTLHLSMLGLRDIASLAQAPMDRRAVVTEVIPYNTKRIEQAIKRELARDGQVFFVHNRVHNIQSVADDIQKLAPDARIVIGHGQMPDGELEDVMLKFMRRQADILVSTTIIESGIDIPTANTMFINDADRFGLAELHQLRGRVGRYKHRAYCYMLLAPDRTVTDKAVKRLKAIEEFSMLGAGFKIAMRDLEIRGAGNILGPEQSGHIAAVGYEMYCQLLDSAVKELRHEPTQVASETSVEIGLSGMIPKRYIASDARRMGAYRRVAVAQTQQELEKIETELKQAYGDALPPATRRLLDLAALRVAGKTLGIRSFAVRGPDVLLRAKPTEARVVHERLSRMRAGEPLRSPQRGAVQEFHVTLLEPKVGEDMAEVYFRPPPAYMDPTTLLRVLRARLAE